MISLTASRRSWPGTFVRIGTSNTQAPRLQLAEFSTSEPVELVVRALGELAMLNAAALDDAIFEAICVKPAATTVRSTLPSRHG